MKYLNKTAAAVFNALIEQMNGEQHLKIDNTEGAFMPAIIERLSEGVDMSGRNVDVYSLSHYFKQNGDLVPDPDMTFAVSQNDSMYIWPLTFQDQYSYKEGIYVSSGKWLINKREQADQTIFANTWLKNIKIQQSIKIKRQEPVKKSNGTINKTWFKNRLKAGEFMVKCTGKYTDDYAFDAAYDFFIDKDFKPCPVDYFDDWVIRAMTVYGDKNGIIKGVFANCEHYQFRLKTHTDFKPAKAKKTETKTQPASKKRSPIKTYVAGCLSGRF